MDEDLRLVEKYISGDTEAVEDIVSKYQRHIFAITYRMTGDIEDAKDLTQKTFVRAVQGLRGFRKESSFKTWLYRIAINLSLNHLKNERRAENGLEESVMTNNPLTLSALIDEEKRHDVRKGLDELPQRQRLAVILRAYEGLSCSETARVMGCSEGAVKAHYHHGVKRLREILKEKGYGIRA